MSLCAALENKTSAGQHERSRVAKLPNEIIWEKLEVYRGQQIWATHVGLFAVRCGLYVRASALLTEIYKFVDEYYIRKLN